MKTEQTKKWSAGQLAIIGMLCAAAYGAKLISNLVPIAVAGFLEFDLKDVIIAICGFICGPLSAVCVSVIVSFIEMITISGTGFIGLIMNILSSCMFSCIAAVLYKHNRSLKGAVFSLIAGVLGMTGCMLLWNYLITPIYMGYPRSAVAAMLIPVFLPFNLIKGGINAALTMLLYRPIVTALHKAHLLKASPTTSGGSRKRGLILVSLLLLVTFALLALALAGII